MYENSRVFTTTFAGRPLTVETGKLAELANGSCLVRYGDTVILATATMAQKPRDGIDYFPLSVDFEERLYAVGKIPGGFLKREGRPSEKAVLAARLIDRPIRPLFPKDMRNDVAVCITVLSVEQDNAPDIVGMLGASIAIAISDIPWNGPIAGVSVGLIDGQYVMNPTAKQREVSRMNVTVVGTEHKVCMIEAGAKEVTNKEMYDGIMEGYKVCREMVEFINSIVKEIGRDKIAYEEKTVDPDMYEAVKEYAADSIRHALDTDDKNIREERLKVVYDDVFEHFAETYPESEEMLSECLYKLQKFVVRRWILDEGRRVDGRGINDLRPLHAEVGLLPRAHGSGLFARGQTQVLTIATLGMIGDAQILDGIDEDESKRYMHHYNMPSYSVGEARPSRGAGRREIGHGALGERALLPVIPSEEEFPYSIRLVSEVLTSNGSTSQGSICGSTLALMDAGVPIKAPVAGISCGLVTEGDRWITMVDIQGVEDFFGDMDFKVAGTKSGITAIQMDLKIDGLTPEIIADALEKTEKARFTILDDVMLPVINAPRPELSPYAPKMLMMTIDPMKIREVIGKGGSVIQKIQADTNTKIDIEDDGRLFIATYDKAGGDQAMATIKAIVEDPEIGAIFKGTVTRLLKFGAFVEFAPGKEGLVHISQLDNKRIPTVEDAVHIGDEVWVKVIEIDDQGRINLSRKAAMNELAKKEEQNQ